MDEEDKEKIKAAAATSVGAGVGGVGGATAGVLELAARQGTVTDLSATVVIAVGGAAGALLSFFGYKLYRRFRKKST